MLDRTQEKYVLYKIKNTPELEFLQKHVDIWRESEFYDKIITILHNILRDSNTTDQIFEYFSVMYALGNIVFTYLLNIGEITMHKPNEKNANPKK